MNEKNVSHLTFMFKGGWHEGKNTYLILL